MPFASNQSAPFSSRCHLSGWQLVSSDPSVQRRALLKIEFLPKQEYLYEADRQHCNALQESEGRSFQINSQRLREEGLQGPGGRSEEESAGDVMLVEREVEQIPTMGHDHNVSVWLSLNSPVTQKTLQVVNFSLTTGTGTLKRTITYSTW